MANEYFSVSKTSGFSPNNETYFLNELMLIVFPLNLNVIYG